MDFPKEVLFPQKVIFEKDGVHFLAREAMEFGSRGMIVHGASLTSSDVLQQVLGSFPGLMEVETYCRKGGEPDLEEVTGLIQILRTHKIEWIAGIGGGSVLDLAKAAAGLMKARERPVFYQEGGVLVEKGIPFIAVPTTAGTGSEATINSVISNPERKNKLSIRDKSFLARKVILDPNFLKGLPGPVMAASAMDALIQGYESYISKNATWFSESFSLKAIELISGHILGSLESGEEEHLASLLLGSYFAGIGLASARLGVIHGIAHPLGYLYGVPHGLVCSACFPASIELNRTIMGKKYETMSSAVGMDFAEKVEKLLSALKLESPFRGKEVIERETIIAETLKSSSTAANPKPITREDVEFILDELFLKSS